MTSKQRLRASKLRKMLAEGEQLEDDEVTWLEWYEARVPPVPGVPRLDGQTAEDDEDDPIEPLVLSRTEAGEAALTDAIIAMRASAELMQRACESWERLANSSTDRLLSTEQQLVDALTLLAGSQSSIEPPDPKTATQQKITSELTTRMMEKFMSDDETNQPTKDT